MTRHIITAFVLASLADVVPAAGDPVAGKEKAQVCASCHGADGVSPAPNFPILAGQYADYIERALKDYQTGERENAIMKGFVTNLSDADIEDLAAWFASQKGLAAPRITNP